jgi:adenylate cyclase class 2
LTYVSAKKSNKYSRDSVFPLAISCGEKLAFWLGGPVAIETEVKIAIHDMDEFRHRLGALDRSLVCGRHFEDNFVLDFKDGRIRSQACLLRVRKTEGKESVTFKGPPRPSTTFKSREEIETTVDSADVMLRILAQAGLETWFRYQKYREEYAVAVRTGPLPEIQLAIDETPIGNYVELEGSEEGILEAAAALGFTRTQFIRDSYYSLFAQYCRQRGETSGHMVFGHQGGTGDDRIQKGP